MNSPLVVAALLTGALRVWSADPSDPWNRIHTSLFVRDGPMPVVRGWPGDDPPEFLFSTDASLPRTPAAIARLATRLEAEGRSPRLQGRTLEARLLFQHDRWRAFDQTFEDERWSPLRAPLVRLMAAVALTAGERDRLRGNWDDVARGFDGLDPEMFEGTSGGPRRRPGNTGS